MGPVDAEEVAQEAFIRIFRGLPKFRGDAALSTWIYRLAVNAALSHRTRRAGARLPTLADERSERQGHRGSAGRGAGAGGRRPARAARAGAGAAADGLPHGHRPPRRRGARARGDRARSSRCHVGTSKSQLHKARARLREILAAGRHHRRRAAERLSDQLAPRWPTTDPGCRHRRDAVGVRRRRPAARARRRRCARTPPPARAARVSIGELRAMVTAARALERPEPPPTLWAGGRGGPGRIATHDRPWWLVAASVRQRRAGGSRGRFGRRARARLLADPPGGGGRGAAAAPAVAAADPLLDEAEAEFAAPPPPTRSRSRSCGACSSARSRAGARRSARAAPSGWPSSTTRSPPRGSWRTAAPATASATSSSSRPTSRRSPSWRRRSTAAAPSDRGTVGAAP